MASVSPAEVAAFEALAATHGVPMLRIGTVGGDRIAFAGTLDVTLADAADAWENGLPRALAG